MTLKEISNRLAIEQNNLFFSKFQFFVEDLQYTFFYNTKIKASYFQIFIYDDNLKFHKYDEEFDCRFNIDINQDIYDQINQIKTNSNIRETAKKVLFDLDNKDWYAKTEYLEFSKEPDSDYLIELIYSSKRNIKLSITVIKYEGNFTIHLFKSGYNNKACIYLLSVEEKSIDFIESIITQLKSEVTSLLYIEECKINKDNYDLWFDKNNHIICTVRLDKTLNNWKICYKNRNLQHQYDYIIPIQNYEEELKQKHIINSLKVILDSYK